MNKIEYTNESGKPVTLWVEPWAWDYTLLPKENLLLKVVSGKSGNNIWLSFFHGECSVQIYVEGDTEIEEILVESKGKKIECGYQREFSTKT